MREKLNRKRGSEGGGGGSFNRTERNEGEKGARSAWKVGRKEELGERKRTYGGEVGLVGWKNAKVVMDPVSKE